MVEIATSVPGVVAARMTGAGFGGCTVNLVRPEAIDHLRIVVERDYPAKTGLRPMVLPVQRDRGRRPAALTRASAAAASREASVTRPRGDVGRANRRLAASLAPPSPSI